MSKKTEGEIAQKMDRRGLLGFLGGGSLALALGAGCGDGGEEVDTANPGERVASDQEELLQNVSLQTPLTSTYGVQYPFVSAGMAFVGVPALAAAVANAGGIGMIGAGIEPPPVIQARIQATKALTTKPFGVNFLVDTGPSGPFFTQDHLNVCLAEGVKIVSFHWNLPDPAWINALHTAGAKVWVQVGAVDVAVQAVALGVDAIIAQGVQAGGHCRATKRTSKLVCEILDAVSSTMVIAAGGIANGVSVVEALSLGAAGVSVGTRLVASTEAYAHQGYKSRLVQASFGGTALQTFFGPEWPGQRQRVLRNRVTNQWAGKETQIPNPPPGPSTIGTTVLFPGVLNVPYTMPKFSAIVPTPDTTGDLEEMDMPAGSDSVLSITSIKSAGQIVADMMSEAQFVINALS